MAHPERWYRIVVSNASRGRRVLLTAYPLRGREADVMLGKCYSASQLEESRSMTKAEAWEKFRREELPSLRQRERDGTGRIDKPRRREAWHNFTDALHRDGAITDRQVETWVHPPALMKG